MATTVTAPPPRTALRPAPSGGPRHSRQELIYRLNEDLGREYHAVIACVVHARMLVGQDNDALAAELEGHARQKLNHTLALARQIDHLGGVPTVTPRPVPLAESPEEMLAINLDNENETVSNYLERVRQCEELGEPDVAEQLRTILADEQERQIGLASALGGEGPAIPLVAG